MADRGLKILSVAAEVAPYSKTGGLADVAGALPQALIALGHEVITISPLYTAVKRKRHRLASTARAFTVDEGGQDRVAHLWQTPDGAAVPGYLVENRALFDRDGLYGEHGASYWDNGERFAFLCRAALMACEVLKFIPDVIHCHDWQAALIPSLLRAQANVFGPLHQVATVMTIHNLQHQGYFPKEVWPVLGLPGTADANRALEFYGGVNLLKGGIAHADAVSTVSRTYAEEITLKDNGHGLHGILAEKREILTGIVNGLDTQGCDPATDERLEAQFTPDSLEKRAGNREAVLKQLTMDQHSGPLLGVVTRLAHQKGIDLIAAAAEEIVTRGMSVVILGDGDRAEVEQLHQLSAAFRGRIGFWEGFDEELAYRIYGGCDMFLMPSRHEPCGLAQLIAMRYGAPPLVHRVGGLVDTVNPVSADGLTGDGFGFNDFTVADFLACLDTAHDHFRKPDRWREIQRRGMTRDLSWGEAAPAYVDLYRKAMARRAGVRAPGRP